MSKFLQHKCNNCGAVKGGTNHWFTVTEIGAALRIDRLDLNNGDLSSIDLCGEACVARYVGQWCEQIRKEYEPPTVAERIIPDR